MNTLTTIKLLVPICLGLSSISFAEQKLQLALNWKAEPQFGGFYQANLKQSFHTLGFDLNVLEGGSGTPTVQMLANGQVDLAIVSAEEILINNDRNPDRPIKALFATFQTSPQMIMCRPESHFNSLSELMKSQATVSLQSGLSYAQFLKKKYPQTKTKWVPYLGGITSFLNEKNFCQQGFFTSEPVLVRSKGLEPDVFLISKEGFNPYTTVVAARAKDIHRYPTGQFIKSLRLAWEAYLRSPQETNIRMQKINKSMDAATFKASAEAQIPLIQPDNAKSAELGRMTEQRWGQLIQQMHDLGLIKSRLKASEQFYP